MSYWLEPFSYSYMVDAIWVSALVGGVCGFLSAYLMLKGWSLIGDALSHSVVPGVVGAHMLGLPYAIGAFLSGGLSALAMLFITTRSRLKTDAVIGLVFSGFFALGLFMISIRPTAVRIDSIIFGNILHIDQSDKWQLVIISVISLVVLIAKWKDLMVVFFDENHARSIGINPNVLKVVFFTVLSASTVAALQAVGAFLVVAMVVTPGATAYLLTDKFPRLIVIASLVGASTCAFGGYVSYFLDGVTGGVIICLQTAILLLAFLFAPVHGLLAARLRVRREGIAGA